MKNTFIILCTICLSLPAVAQNLPKKLVQRGSRTAAKSSTRFLEKTLAKEINEAQTAYADELKKAAHMYPLRSTNRQMRKQSPNTKYKLSKQDKGPWLYKKLCPPSYGFWDKNAAVQIIVDKAPNLAKGLAAIRQMQQQLGEQDFYALFMMKWYIKYFDYAAMHQRHFFEHIANLHNRELEDRVARRIDFLLKHEPQFRQIHNISQPRSVRICYTEDVFQITPKNFDESKLLLARESSYEIDTFLPPAFNLTPFSKVNIGGLSERVYHFNKIKHLVTLYRFLMGDLPHQPLQVLDDAQRGTLFIYNAFHTRWIRVSPHEYTDPASLHLHLNQIEPWKITLGNGTVIEENMVEVLTIPLYPAPGKSPDYLYNAFIDTPLKELRKDPAVSAYKTK